MTRTVAAGINSSMLLDLILTFVLAETCEQFTLLTVVMNFKNVLQGTEQVFQKVLTLREHDGQVELLNERILRVDAPNAPDSQGEPNQQGPTLPPSEICKPPPGYPTFPPQQGQRDPILNSSMQPPPLNQNQMNQPPNQGAYNCPPYQQPSLLNKSNEINQQGPADQVPASCPVPQGNPNSQQQPGQNCPQLQPGMPPQNNLPFNQRPCDNPQSVGNRPTMVPCEPNPCQFPPNPNQPPSNPGQFPPNPCQLPSNQNQPPPNSCQFPSNQCQQPSNPGQFPLNPNQPPPNSCQFPPNQCQQPSNPGQFPPNPNQPQNQNPQWQNQNPATGPNCPPGQNGPFDQGNPNFVPGPNCPSYQQGLPCAPNQNCNPGQGPGCPTPGGQRCPSTDGMQYGIPNQSGPNLPPNNQGPQGPVPGQNNPQQCFPTGAQGNQPMYDPNRQGPNCAPFQQQQGGNGPIFPAQQQQIIGQEFRHLGKQGDDEIVQVVEYVQIQSNNAQQPQ